MDRNKLKEYIKQANEIHNKFYNYGKTNPMTIKDKTVITCPIHGDFYMSLDSHIHGKCGCPKCKKVHKYTNEEWITAVDNVHNHKYDYSKTVYTKAKEKVCVVCHEKDEFGREHGEFYIRAGNHMAGIGCPKCGGRYNMTMEEFLLKANKRHQNKYDYSKIKFNGTQNKICIICHEKDEFGREHGEFYQRACSHLMGCGCPKCNKGVSYTQEEFIKMSNKIHNSFYDYSKVVYETARKKVDIICPIHGLFIQSPHRHLKGHGCPKCKSSRMEIEVISMLEKFNILFEHQSRILSLGGQTVDFYLPKQNIIIECQGEQHFVPARFSTSITYSEAIKMLEDRIDKDRKKYEESVANGIDIIYYINKEYFSRKNINTDIDFYKGKKVFYSLAELQKFIEYTLDDNKEAYSSLRDDFYMKMKQSFCEGILKDGVFVYKKYGVYFQILSHTEKRQLYDKQRSFSKNGRKLIIVFEDEYYQNPDLVLQKIRHVFGEDKMYTKKVYGRKCIIREISKDKSEAFLTKNHIQGFVGASVYIGAFYEKELVGVMSFLREGGGVWNLNRFASNNEYRCCGVAGKMFHFFITKYKCDMVKSFADMRWTLRFDNNLYTKIGFSFEGKLQPNYHYANKQKTGYSRFHKFCFRKNILHRKYGLPLSMTEKEMCDTLGFYRIWDCGLFKYVWRKQ